jgi:hypothetical protein
MARGWWARGQLESGGEAHVIFNSENFGE